MRVSSPGCLALPSLTPRLTFAIVLVVSLLLLLFRSAIPVSAEGYLIQDDALFVRLAHNILQGQWLGPFDNLTLAKGAFYPLFIATSRMVGLPLKIAEQLFHLSCAGIAAYAIWRFSRSRGFSVAAFALLAANPLFWHPIFARVLRENIYVGEGLALIALASLVAFGTRAGDRPRLSRVALLFAFGLAFAAYWLTREESVWLYPSLTVIALGGVLERFCAWRDRGTPPVEWVEIASSVAGQAAIAFGGFAALAGTIAVLNYNAYGVFLTNEFREGNLESAFGALMRIKPAVWTPYLVFQDDVAQRAYAVSPAAAELKPGLEGPSGEDFRVWGCRVLGITPCPRSFAGGWFVWALRDAVRDAGYYHSAPEAQAFYARLATEVNAACDTKELQCLAARSTMTPPFRSDYLGRGFQSFLGSLGVLFGARPVAVGTAPSKGREDQVTPFRDVAGRIAPPEGGGAGVAPSWAIEEESWTVMRAFAEIYRLAVWVLLGVGTLGFLLVLVRYRVAMSNIPLVTLALAAGGAVIVRAALVAYIDVSSWHAVNELYLSPASPFVPMFGLVGAFVGLAARKSLRTRSAVPTLPR